MFPELLPRPRSTSSRAVPRSAGLVLVVALLAGAPAGLAGTDADDLARLRERLEEEVRRHPESGAVRLSLAKVLHFRAVDGDAAAARESTELLERLATERPGDPAVLAYLGSARLVAARLCWNPWRKMSLANEGVALLDRAVAAAPDDPEVRFLRGGSTRPLPGYFGRSESSSEDLAAAAARAPEASASGRLDKSLAAAIFYLYGFTRLDHADRTGTEAAWRKAVEIAPASTAGKKAAGRLVELAARR